MSCPTQDREKGCTRVGFTACVSYPTPCELRCVRASSTMRPWSWDERASTSSAGARIHVDTSIPCASSSLPLLAHALLRIPARIQPSALARGIHRGLVGRVPCQRRRVSLAKVIASATKSALVDSFKRAWYLSRFDGLRNGFKRAAFIFTIRPADSTRDRAALINLVSAAFVQPVLHEKSWSRQAQSNGSLQDADQS